MLKKRYSYSFKLVNSIKKSDYRIYNIREGVKFDGIVSLENFIKSTFKEFHDCDNDLRIGYVEPGHGWKGRQQWINSDEDMNELYSVYKDAKCIMLWCYLPKKDNPKRKSRKSTDEPVSKRAKCVENNDVKINEANFFFETLKMKHEKLYKTEQLHAWAQLIQMKKHESLEDPPDYPFFKGKKQRKQKFEETSTSDECECAPIRLNCSQNVGISPGKRIHMRTECIEQLQKIGQLLENGIISQLQYDKLQETIMKDVNKF